MTRSQAFASDMDKLDRRTRELGPVAREAALHDLFLREARDMGEDFAEDLFAEYLGALEERGIEDPFGLPDWLYGCSTLLAQDYDRQAGFAQADWAAIARCVDGSSGALDLDFINYAMSLILEGGGLR